MSLLDRALQLDRELQVFMRRMSAMASIWPRAEPRRIGVDRAGLFADAKFGHVLGDVNRALARGEVAAEACGRSPQRGIHRFDRAFRALQSHIADVPQRIPVEVTAEVRRWWPKLLNGVSRVDEPRPEEHELRVELAKRVPALLEEHVLRVQRGHNHAL